MASKLLPTAFSGFFLALALVNLIFAAVVRSRASAAFAGLMAVMVALVAAELTRPASALLDGVLLGVYLTATVAFAVIFLQAWRQDRIMTWVVEGVLVVTYPFVNHAYAPYGLLLALIVLGVRALGRDRYVAIAYMAAFAGPLLTVHFPVSSVAFYGGVAWQAAAFAFAVALRNRNLQAEHDRFEQLARLDELTGVANRRTFDQELKLLWEVARRSTSSLAMLMIDIDHFKNYNDTHGHLAGDTCLRNVARRCASLLRRSGDCFGRYGGEEFAALLLGTDLERAMALAEQMRAAAETDGEVTISIGVAAFVPTTDLYAESLIEQADTALYQAKQTGRNRVVAADAQAQRRELGMTT
ncbi:MAG TPA: GGDEF domain-containing protein [Candidatus Baltobacteraceae bacterium]|nr:GGDEF domain-containing protein [Candidatus Baltobacteraceae bacterium]